MREELRNGSGYVDLTAYKAMQKIEREENEMEFKRGEIYEVGMTTTNETKYAVIVSADFRRNDSRQSAIVMANNPIGMVNVKVDCGGETRYADCGNVSFLTVDKVQGYVCDATEDEMRQIDEGLRKCLGLDAPAKESKIEAPAKVENSEELVVAKAEAKIYRDLYEKLLAKVMA